MLEWAKCASSPSVPVKPSFSCRSTSLHPPHPADTGDPAPGFPAGTLKEACAGADALLVLNTIAPGFDPLSEADALRENVVVLDTRASVDAARLPKSALYWKI